MGKPVKSMALAAFTLLATSLTIVPQVASAATAEQIKQGKEIAYDRKQGNCLACHHAGDGVSPGDIGPPLVGMKARFPDRAKLRAQIFDPRVNNPDTSMPPFGAHKIISGSDIDRVVDFLLTL